MDDGQWYIGSTSNLKRRLLEHSRGYKAGTRFSKKPKLLFSQDFESISLARRIEYRLKKYKSKKILDKIIKDKVIKKILGP
jgi:predicted GIY-YIG superfamily endonuclease